MRSRLSKQVIAVIAVALVLVVICSCAGFLLADFNINRSSVRDLTVAYCSHISNYLSRDELVRSVGNYDGDTTLVIIYSESGEIIASNAAQQAGVDLKEMQKVKEKGGVFGSLNIQGKRFSTYTSAVEVARSVDSYGYIYIKCGIRISYAKPRFWLFCGGAIVAAIVLIIFACLLLKMYIKRSMKPLEAVQNGLQEINNGNFRASGITTEYEEYEGIINEINDIGQKISNALSHTQYEQKKSAFLMDNIGQGIVALSADGKIMLNNNAVLDIFGIQYSTVGAHISTLIDDKAVLNILSETVATECDKECELRLRGKIYRVESKSAHSARFENLGNIAAILLFTDITQEMKSAAIRSEFFANASHELKTPLTVIKGYSEVLTLSGIDAGKIAKCAEEINANASKMSMLISDMLYMSRLDADINNEELELVDLGKVCREICEDMTVSAKMSDISIYFEGSAFAMCYPKMIATAITNLVSNAVKYGKKGGGVWVKVGETDNEAFIEVKDNGIGISEENKGRVFERFFKVDTARTGSDEVSTGLGLAIVKHIVANIHKGVITLDSVLGEGSIFKIILPKEIGESK